MQLPQRRSLTVETKRVIQDMIRSGELQQKLPGERELAARLQIGRDTLRTALAELEKKGWISVGAHGKRRDILKGSSTKETTTTSRRIGFLSPKHLEALPPAMLLELDHMREMLASKDISLELRAPSVFSLRRPEAKLENLVHSVPCDAWILYQSTEQMQRWFQKKHIPCLVRGQAYPGVDLPSLDLDWQAIGFHAGATLTRHGHSSIGLMMPDKQLQGLFSAQKGIEEALAQSTDPSSLLTITEQGTTDAVTASLEKIWQAKHPPTAIITTRSRQVLTLISWLASRRMRIPDDVSLVCLTDDNVFGSLVPEISHYALDRALMARCLVRKLDAVIKHSRIDHKLLIPDFTAGGSVSTRD